MKRNGKNIITSDDVTVLGKNSGKTLEQVLESLQTESDELKSNVKWLYKYGGVGGKGGSGGSSGGSSTTDRWTVICSLGEFKSPRQQMKMQALDKLCSQNLVNKDSIYI